MNTLQNLHQHTTFCDGADTPEETINEAISRGFGAIGFSGHSYMHYSEGHSMSIDGTEQYKKTIASLKAKYSGQIDVFCGLEFDMFSKIDLSGYDYIIGSVHYLKIGDEYVGFDRDAKAVKNVIDTYFGGNGIEYAKEYYRHFATLSDYGSFDILGHFDLITKHKEKADFFDCDSKEYRFAAVEAAEALAGKIKLFEINTGAISRGYRTTPYPDPFIIKEMKRLGYGAIISSDCHNKNFIDCNFCEAEELLLSCGYKEKYILTNNGFIPVGLRDNDI